MGFGGEAGGGVNLINNKFPSAPQSHALCLIALYWFFSLSFFSFFGRALLSFWNNQVAKVDLGVECHLFSLLLLLPLLHPLIPPPPCSPFPLCLLFFTLSGASQLSRLSPNDFRLFAKGFWETREIASTVVSTQRHIFTSYSWRWIE